MEYNFYTITVIEGKTKITISRAKLVEFWQNKGFRKLKLANDGFELVQITRKSIIKLAKDEDLMHSIKEYLLNVEEKPEVWEEFLKGDYINKKNNLALDVVENLALNISTKNLAFFFFKNGVVKVTANDMLLIPYENYDGFLMQEQIIDHEIILPKDRNYKRNSNFNKFIQNITGDNIDRYHQLTTSIGYIIHPYKDPAFTKAVILVDEKLDFSGEANGGTGKSLVGRAIQKMVSSLQKDGKALNSRGNRFFYQDIKLYHRVLILDDVIKDFDFEYFYSVVTGEMTIEEKYKSSYKVPFELSPKLFISSNYMIQGSGGNSDERRKIEIEIAPYYNKDFTPIEEFGERFFNDWNNEEWNKFYLDMASYCQEYINEGIKNVNPINLKENKLKLKTDISFVEFAEINIIFSEGQREAIFNKADLYSSYRHAYPVESKNVTAIKFKKWLDEYADARNLTAYHYKSDSNIMVRFSKK